MIDLIADPARACARMFCMGFKTRGVGVETCELVMRGIGGVVLFKRNYDDPQQLADLCGDLKSGGRNSLLICADQEGGRVIRFGPPFSAVPSMRAVGQRGDARVARQIGRLLARELRAVNIDIDLAPVLDVDTNPANPVIADRSFGRTPQLATEMGLALIDGMQSAGVGACAKHFPGHGDTAQDSHLELPRLSHSMDRLSAVELAPFAAAAKAGVASIMTAHVIFEAVDPKYPATMSKPVLTGLLRQKLGYGGVIMSDDLGMKAVAEHFSLDEIIIRGANAGVDMFLMADDAPTQHEAIDILIRAVERGEVSREIIEAANRRLYALFNRYVRQAVRPDYSVIGCEEHRRVIAGFGPAGGTAPDPTAYTGNR